MRRRLTERIVKAFADIVDAPGGLLLVGDGGRGLAVAAPGTGPARQPGRRRSSTAPASGTRSRPAAAMLEFEALRRAWARPRDNGAADPAWLIDEPGAGSEFRCSTIDRLIGLVVLAAPEYRRPLDWEDFDLLRTAATRRRARSPRRMSQEALANAQRFEEFNRRFAFILHDIKNLVSQLSLLARNAERHADNPEFRADMVATLAGARSAR